MNKEESEMNHIKSRSTRKLFICKHFTHFSQRELSIGKTLCEKKRAENGKTRERRAAAAATTNTTTSSVCLTEREKQFMKFYCTRISDFFSEPFSPPFCCWLQHTHTHTQQQQHHVALRQLSALHFFMSGFNLRVI